MSLYDTSEARTRGTGRDPEVVAQWRRESRQNILRTWAERLEHPSASVHLISAIQPVLEEWLNRRHGTVTYRLTQTLTGHGCFGRYLFKVARREPSPACHHCGHIEDTAAHTLAECPAWATERGALVAAIGPDLSLPAVIRSMLGSDVAWNAMLAYSETVITQKEDAERVQELDPNADPRRQRRVGRRRVAHNRRPP
ncbi:uncharacterized protein LOC142985956 [Anticarsia gemmatalis]|uniref:uncharacterized protein LOC142985956 n=1 Tax=Anticarsia gemmatalis TaxID=129554 RepID=UPI003F75768D